MARHSILERHHGYRTGPAAAAGHMVAAVEDIGFDSLEAADCTAVLCSPWSDLQWSIRRTYLRGGYWLLYMMSD